MLNPGYFTLFTILVYAAASVCGVAGLVRGRKPMLALAGRLALLAFFCQTAVLILGFHKSPDGFLSLGAYLQLLAWFILLCGVSAWWRLHHETLLLFALPLGLILFLLSAPSLDMSIRLPGYLSLPFYALHIGALFLSLGLLGLGCVASLLFLLLERKLKERRQLHGFWEGLPAITLLDKINSACGLAAFPLYTLGLVAGLFWAIPAYGQRLATDPKELTSLLVWLLLAVLFHNRLAKNWRGRKPAILTLVIFSLSLASLFAVNFLLETHHGFTHS